MSTLPPSPSARPAGRALVLAAAGAILAISSALGQEAETSPSPSADGAVETAAGIDGTWVLDTSIGDFADSTSAWVGFRVAEVLQNIGETEAVGRTPLVSGQLRISGTVIESAVIEADLTGIRSDRSRRDQPIQRALETNAFPTATFVSAEPVDLGALPGDEAFEITIPGILTIHGVSQEREITLIAQQVGETVAVVSPAEGLPVDFTSFGIEMPTAPIVVSVEDDGSLEWRLFFTRES